MAPTPMKRRGLALVVLLVGGCAYLDPQAFQLPVSIAAQASAAPSATPHLAPSTPAPATPLPATAEPTPVPTPTPRVVYVPVQAAPSARPASTPRPTPTPLTCDEAWEVHGAAVIGEVEQKAAAEMQRIREDMGGRGMSPEAIAEAQAEARVKYDAQRARAKADFYASYCN